MIAIHPLQLEGSYRRGSGPGGAFVSGGFTVPQPLFGGGAANQDAAADSDNGRGGAGLLHAPESPLGDTDGLAELRHAEGDGFNGGGFGHGESLQIVETGAV